MAVAPTPRSEQLRELAQRVADRFPPDVVPEILLTGSVSRGIADEGSDIELLLVSDVLPPPEERLALAAAAGLEELDTLESGDRPIWWTEGLVDGDVVELIWWSRAYVDERVDRILAAEIVDHARLRSAEAIANGLVLRTSGAAAVWQARLSVYPPALVDAVVADAALDWTEQPRSILAKLRPGDRLVLALQLTSDAENMLRLLCAVNRVWEPGRKRLAFTAEQLPRKPVRFAERVEAALVEPDGAWALRAARELVRDTLSFAPDLPEVVVARERVARLLEALA